ncbi:MAG: SMI1/KNR4 family protein [Polyangiaceae bacterium]
METNDAWARIEAWYAKQGVSDLELNPPADDAAITAAEQAMGIQFSDDFKASLKVHNGQANGAERFLFPGIARLASLEAMVTQWQEEREYDQEDDALSDDEWFQLTLFHPKRVPIAGVPYWDGDNAYLDFAPGPNGVAGQLLAMTSECDFVVLAKTFTDMLMQTAEMMERGDLVVEDEHLNLASGEWGGHPAETLCVAKGY